MMMGKVKNFQAPEQEIFSTRTFWGHYVKTGLWRLCLSVSCRGFICRRSAFLEALMWHMVHCLYTLGIDDRRVTRRRIDHKTLSRFQKHSRPFPTMGTRTVRTRSDTILFACIFMNLFLSMLCLERDR